MKNCNFVYKFQEIKIYNHLPLQTDSIDTLQSKDYAERITKAHVMLLKDKIDLLVANIRVLVKKSL